MDEGALPWPAFPRASGSRLLVVAFRASPLHPRRSPRATTPCRARPEIRAPCSPGGSTPRSTSSPSNGGFEQGADDWELRGDAAVVPGNESFAVHDAADASSLSLGSGGSAEMRTACVGLLEPTVRLFVKAPRVLGARLRIDATVVNPTTGLTLQTNYVVLGGLAPAGWAPTAPILDSKPRGRVAGAGADAADHGRGHEGDVGRRRRHVDPFRQR